MERVDFDLLWPFPFECGVFVTFGTLARLTGESAVAVVGARKGVLYKLVLVAEDTDKDFLRPTLLGVAIG